MRATPLALGLFLAVGSLLTAGEVKSQVVAGEFGFTVTDSTGASAGASCWGFTCTPHQLSVPQGTNLDLMLRAPLNQPYWIGVSLVPLGCVSLPFAEHSLVLQTATLATLTAGVIDQRNTLRYCWGGFAIKQVRLPPLVLPGTQFALQALTIVPTLSGQNRLAFSAAVLTTVR